MIYIADSNWFPTNDNPFTDDGLYGNRWSAFIYDPNIRYCTNVYKNAKLYTVCSPPKDDEDHARLYDFLFYETSHGRNVILKETAAINAKQVLDRYNMLNHEILLRDSDYPYMVHSTTLQNWDSIQKDGAVFSPNMLKTKGRTVQEIGLKALLEPNDYSDYIMLDKPDGCGELVVNSRNLGHICLNPTCSYTPGVRLYFDVKKMIADRIVVRDGFHILKVKDKLPLNNYLLLAITAEDFPSNIDWTPTLFTEKANQLFFSIIGNIQCIISCK